MFSTSFLKHIAIITMIIDHVGSAFFPNNILCRVIGRMSFIIFCYLLTLGATFTKNSKKYFFRLFIFAIISFVPFSLFGFGECFYLKYLNVFFTLSFSLLMIYLLDYVKNIRFNNLLKILILISFCFIGIYFNFDYGFIGFLFVYIFYEFKNKKFLIITCCIISSLLCLPIVKHYFYYEIWTISIVYGVLEFIGLISLFFILKCNGQKGKQLPKLFYYSFYPVHLLIIWLVKCYIL